MGFGNRGVEHKEMRLHKEILVEFIYFKGFLKQKNEDSEPVGSLPVAKQISSVAELCALRSMVTL